MDFKIIIWDLLYTFIVIGFTFVGIYVGYILTKRDQIRRDKTELEKIHKLISLEFSRIFHLCQNMKKNHDYIKNNPDDFSKSFEATMVNSMMGLTFNLHFYHRATLENSGSLIKLKPDEIQKIQFAYEQISNTSKNSENAWFELTRWITYKFRNDNNPSRLKLEIESYLEVVYGSYKVVDKVFEQLKIDWINLDSFLDEYPSEREKMKKFLNEN